MADKGLNIEINGDITGLQKALKQALAANDNLLKSIDKVGDVAQEAGNKGAKGMNNLGDAAKKTGGILQSAFSGIKSEIGGFTGNLSNSIPVLGNVASKLGIVGIAAGAAVGGIIAVSKSILDTGRAAQRAGVGFEGFQRWEFASKSVGVEIDALTDGLKELNLRSDEFAQTGKGSAAEAFTALGYSAKDVASKIKEPVVFLEEILNKLRQVDAAARTRMLDEIFGGTAAEQFAYFLGISADKLKEILDSPEIITESELARIKEVDAKFRSISATIDNEIKRGVVDVIGFLTIWRDRLNEIEDRQLDTLKVDQADTDMERLNIENEIMRLEGLGDAISFAESNALASLKSRLAVLNDESARIANTINAINNPAAPKMGRISAPEFDSGRFGTQTSGEEAQKAAQKELETAIKNNKTALDQSTRSLENLAQRGLTPLEQQRKEEEEISRLAEEARKAAIALGQLDRIPQINANEQSALSGVRMNAARSTDATTYLNQFNPYGKDIERLQGNLASALRDMVAAMPEGLRSQVVINSAYRSIEKQTELWNAAVKKYGSEAAARKWVAPPGKSMHNTGQAVDLGMQGGSLLSANSQIYQWIKQNMGSFGLTQPMSNEPWHFEMQGARGQQKIKDEEAYAQKVQESNEKLAQQGQQLTDQYDPLAQRNRLMAEANELLRAGVISQEVYNARIKDINVSYQEAVNKAKESNDEMMKSLESLTSSWMDSLIDGLIDGNMNWQQFMGQIAKDLMKLAANAALKSIKGSMGGTSGGLTGSFGAAASGGQKEGWTMVGERGPELVDLGNGARVYNNPSTRAMMGGAKSSSAPVIHMTTNVQVPNATNEADRQKTARVVEKSLEAKIYETMSKIQTPGRLRG